MFALRLRSLSLLVFCLVVLAVSSTARAKKPPKDPPTPPPPPPVKYQIVWLPVLSLDSWTFASDINALGTVVGSTDAGNPDGRALRWDVTTDFECEDLNDALEDLIPEDYVLNTAERISNEGHIVGYCTDDSGEQCVFAYDPLVPQITIVDVPGSAYDRFFIYDVNDHGTVVGGRHPSLDDDGEGPVGVVWFSALGAGEVQLLSHCVLTGINEHGVIVGLVSEGDGCPRGEVFRTDSGNLEQREFLGKRTDLGCGFAYGWPVINDQGTVAALINAGRKDMYLYGGYYSAGQWTTLTEERAVFVTDINDQGNIVGYHFGEKPASRHPNPGFVYLTGESGPDDDQYWNLDEHIVTLHGEVDDVWLTGDTWHQSIADITSFTDPNGTGFSMISGNKGGYPYVLVPIAPEP